MTGARYAAAMQAATRRLPFGLADVVPPTLLGFGLINLSTFALDLVLLDVLHGRGGWPLPLAVSVAYGVALTTSYLLNRVLNFRSRAPIGRQFAINLVVVLVNYIVCVLGVSAGLSAVGLDYRLARVAAGLCEAAFLYLALRHAVFGGAGADVGTTRPAAADQVRADQLRADSMRGNGNSDSSR